jgi:hypothetical protein
VVRGLLEEATTVEAQELRPQRTRRRQRAGDGAIVKQPTHQGTERIEGERVPSLLRKRLLQWRERRFDGLQTRPQRLEWARLSSGQGAGGDRAPLLQRTRELPRGRRQRSQRGRPDMHVAQGSQRRPKGGAKDEGDGDCPQPLVDDGKLSGGAVQRDLKDRVFPRYERSLRRRGGVLKASETLERERLGDPIGRRRGDRLGLERRELGLESQQGVDRRQDALAVDAVAGSRPR